MENLVPLGTGNSRLMKSNISSNTTLAQLIQMWNNGTFPYDIGPLNSAGISQQGTPLNKDTLLKDTTAALYGLGTDATPDEVLAILSKAVLSTSDGDIKLPSGDSVPGIPKLVYGSYVGNGNTTALVHTTGLPYFLIVSGIGDGDNDPDGTSLVVCRNAPSFRTMSGPMAVAIDAETIVWQDKQVYWNGPSAKRILNRSGVTYYYVYAV